MSPEGVPPTGIVQLGYFVYPRFRRRNQHTCEFLADPAIVNREDLPRKLAGP